MALDKDNRLLSPTTGQEWEAGIRYNPKSSIQITASVFDLRRQNIHVPVWGESYYTSIGEITSQGFELEGRAVINDYLRILGSYTYMDPRVTQHTNPARIGKRPAGVANHSFNIRADAVLSRFDNGELTWGIGLRHIGKRMDEDNEITLGGVTLYDTSYHSHGGITPGRFISATSSIRNTYPALNLFGVFPPDSPDRNAHGSFPISISGDHEKYKTVKSFLRPWWHLASPFWKSEKRMQAGALLVLAMIFNILDIYMTVRLNTWSRDFLTPCRTETGMNLFISSGCFWYSPQLAFCSLPTRNFSAPRPYSYGVSGSPTTTHADGFLPNAITENYFTSALTIRTSALRKI